MDSAPAPLFGDYDPEWPRLFEALGNQLRKGLGDVACRIDHIGSTAVRGLAAKPIVDIQISVVALEPMATYRAAIEQCGFIWRADNPDRTKRYFRELSAARRTHIHVRRLGSYSEQQALLFRDYLRAHPDRAAAYADVKRRLARLLASDRQAYLDGKDAFVWEMLRLAHCWSQDVGWEPGPSDA